MSVSKRQPFSPTMNHRETMTKKTEELAAFHATYIVESSDEIISMFEATALLEEDLSVGDNWLIYGAISEIERVDGLSEVTITVQSDAGIGAFEQADSVTEIQQ